jgi:hypothetical protein
VPEKKTKVDLPGKGLVDASEVAVNESTERWTDVLLADGSVLRIKPVVLAALRIDNEYDAEGNPLYQVKVNQIMTVTAPEHLKKSAQGSSKTH